MLVSYFYDHHIDIKYVLEISFIAPAIEIIFAASQHSLALNIVFGVFSLASLLVYVLFYETITKIDDDMNHINQEQQHYHR